MNLNGLLTPNAECYSVLSIGESLAFNPVLCLN